jgi:hypothetical protein
VRSARSAACALALALGGAFAIASVAGDPKLYAGSECCACLQITSPSGENLESKPVGERSAGNCLPGDTAEDETCANEVASQIDSSGGGDPVRVFDSACYETHCREQCASAVDNGITFTVSDGS